jgi:tetratricopeptide (TPR) repeat protein
MESMNGKHCLCSRAASAWVVVCMSVLFMSAPGCVSKSGARPSIWPTETLNGSAGTSVGQALSKTATSMKGQFANVGSAMSSAYSKTKTAITSPFSTASTTSSVVAPSTPSKSASVAPEILVAQGSYFESQGNYAKAIDSYSRALETDAKNPIALLAMARLYDHQKDPAKAMEFYRKTIEVAPNSGDAYSELGQLQARSGNLKDARAELQKAVNLQPKNRAYRAALAGILLDSGEPDAALEELRQVESPAMAHYQMAYLHFNRKNIPGTQQQLAASLQIDPNLKPARDLLNSLGGAQNVSNMIQQGQQIYQQTGTFVGDVSRSVQGFAPAPGQLVPAPVGPGYSGPENQR